MIFQNKNKYVPFCLYSSSLGFSWGWIKGKLLGTRCWHQEDKRKALPLSLAEQVKK